MSPTSLPLQFWLPPLDHFDVRHPLHRQLARADRLPDGPRGDLGGLGGYFPCDAQPLPAAALVREQLMGDAGDDVWLNADPAWVQPDINGVRLIAGGRMQLDDAQVQVLLQALRPAFDEAGLQLEITTPDRWQLRLPPDTVLPPFDTTEQALGEDLLQHLPPGPEGRRWRVLLNEIQVLLHEHPLQAQRRARGLAPVNSVWFWGGGRLPPHVSSPLAGAISDDPLLLALASRAGVARSPRTSDHVAAAAAGWLVDLHDLPVDAFTASWWPVLAGVLQRRAVRLDFASGERWLSRPWHRWRFWRGAAA